MAEQHTQLEAAATRSTALAAVRAQLNAYVNVLNGTEGMVLPVLYMTVVLDATLAHLVARHLQGVYDKVGAGRQVWGTRLCSRVPGMARGAARQVRL